MERKLILPVLFCFAIGITVSFVLQGCRENKSMAKSVEKTMYVPIIKTVTNTIIKHDTIRVKRKLNADSTIQAAYKQNYDLFFAPDFQRMNNVINKQASAIYGFANIITSMRTRAIAHNDSMEIRNNRYIQQALRAQQEALQARKEYEKNVQDQIKSNNRVTIICLTGTIILFVFMVCLFLYCRSRFKQLDKLIANA